MKPGLSDIVRRKKADLSKQKSRVPLAVLKRKLAKALPVRNFAAALRKGPGLSLIAELKKASPSAGLIRLPYDVAHGAGCYARGGASALSILTEENYFLGRLEHLTEAKKASGLPVLRKDFIIDPYQVYEAAFSEADAVLLIVRILTEEQLVQCMQAADTLGIEPLVEVHTAEELKLALSVGAHVIGINHRDLSTFSIDPKLSEQLVPLIPAGKLIVAESGIQTAEDVKRMKQLGVHALLIGEALMKAPDPAAKVRELFTGIW